MKQYRITFYRILKGGNEQHIESLITQATHFHVFLNNKKLAEHSKLENAINTVIENHGENKDLHDLVDHIPYIKNPVGFYECVGIIYYEKYGLKLEMRIRENSL